MSEKLLNKILAIQKVMVMVADEVQWAYYFEGQELFFALMSSNRASVTFVSYSFLYIFTDGCWAYGRCSSNPSGGWFVWIKLSYQNLNLEMVQWHRQVRWGSPIKAVTVKDSFSVETIRRWWAQEWHKRV
jgi:hypothetical protein